MRDKLELGKYFNKPCKSVFVFYAKGTQHLF